MDASARVVARTGSRRSAVGRLALLVALLGALAVLIYVTGLSRYLHISALAALLRGFRGLPFAAPLFVLVYALAVLAVPATVMTIVGGAIFGFALGALLSWLGAMIGAVLAYYLARALGADAVHRLLGRRARAALDKVAVRHGFGTVLSLRILPVAPFNVINLAAGLAAVRPRDYLAATALGQIPITLAFSYFAGILVAAGHATRRAIFLRLGAAALAALIIGLAPMVVQRLGARARSAASDSAAELGEATRDT